MTIYAITLSDNTTDIISEAEAYKQEGPMTTFFSFGENRSTIDSWSIRVASYRTTDIVAIRRSCDSAQEDRQHELVVA